MNRHNDKKNPSLNTEEVGYGKPPKSGRFRPGCSGNPKGRPRGGLNVASTLAKALRERITVGVNGRQRCVTKLEAAFLQLINMAVHGEVRAIRHLMDLAQYAEAKLATGENRQPVLSDLDQEVMADLVRRIHELNSEPTMAQEEQWRPN